MYMYKAKVVGVRQGWISSSEYNIIWMDVSGCDSASRTNMVVWPKMRCTRVSWSSRQDLRWNLDIKS